MQEDRTKILLGKQNWDNMKLSCGGSHNVIDAILLWPVQHNEGM